VFAQEYSMNIGNMEVDMITRMMHFCVFDYDCTIADVPVDWKIWRPRVRVYLSELCGDDLFDDCVFRVDEMEFRAVNWLQNTGRTEETPKVFALRREAEVAASNQHIAHADVIKLVQELSFRQVRLFICSNNLRETVAIGLKQLGLDTVFEDVVGIDDALIPKPSPVGLKLLMKRHKLSEGKGCVVGDSEATDGEAARLAGLPYFDVRQLPLCDYLTHLR
jgi:HAD superfamily hydrolase (TIGR01549 family)